MKLQIISVNKYHRHGFVLVELILLISISSILIVSIQHLEISIRNMKSWSINRLSSLELEVVDYDQALRDNNAGGIKYGNYSRIIESETFKTIKSDFYNSWGDSSCYPRIDFDINKVKLNKKGINIGNGNISTDLEVRNSFIYLSADSSVQSMHDLFIIDNTDNNNPFIVSSINTGPGVVSLAVSGPFIYLANTSSNSQLQIVDMHDRYNPYLISSLKLPLPNASSSSPRSESIFYRNGYVYIGTNKWDGPELVIIDVSNPSNPIIVGSLETNTLINDIYVYDNKAHLATSDQNQMRVVDVSDKSNPILSSTFTTTGWEVQQGNVVDLFEDNIILGRTVGGFNRINNHEVFVFSTTSIPNQIVSKDIPTGVYGLISRNQNIFILTHDFGREFQVWNSNLSNKIFEISLGLAPISMKCDWRTLYFTTGDNHGFYTMEI